jgi:hypothetical protein
MPTYAGSRLSATGKFAVSDVGVSQMSWSSKTIGRLPLRCIQFSAIRSFLCRLYHLGFPLSALAELTFHNLPWALI